MKLIVALPLCCLPCIGQASHFYISTDMSKVIARCSDINADASANISKNRGNISGEFSEYRKYFKNYIYNINVGYSFNSGFRTELSIKKNAIADFDSAQIKKQENRLSNNSFHGKISGYSLLANLYYDVDFGTRFIPYAKIGVGIARHKFIATHNHQFSFITNAPIEKSFTHYNQSVNKKSNRFIVNAGIGSTYVFSRHVALYSGITYTQLSKVQTPTNTPNVSAKVQLAQTDVSVGIRYTF